jgi:hypothetical protein
MLGVNWPGIARNRQRAAGANASRLGSADANRDFSAPRNRLCLLGVVRCLLLRGNCGECDMKTAGKTLGFWYCLES